MASNQSNGGNEGRQESYHKEEIVVLDAAASIQPGHDKRGSFIEPSGSPISASVPTHLKVDDANHHLVGSTVESTIRRENHTHMSLPLQPTFQQPATILDVYAPSFVPVWLRGINEELAAAVVISPRRHKISFEEYVRSFAGHDVLAHESKVRASEDQSLMTELNEHNYMPYFASLARLEKQAKEKEVEQHALYRVPLQSITRLDGTNLWSLSIPGLREDSPLIELGDILHIRQLWVDWAGNCITMPLSHPMHGHHVTYETWTKIHYISAVYGLSRVKETVYLRVDELHNLIDPSSGMSLPVVVNVVFTTNKRVVQGQRKALQAVSARLANASANQGNDWIRRMLFPDESDGQLQTVLRSIPHRDLFDDAVNYEQAHAVNSICSTDYGTLPYLISGPPGTGKTKTLVETAMQLLQTTEAAHLLICAPSDAAADTLALRLMRYLDRQQLLRLNAPSRADNEVPQELLSYCFIQDDMFYLPPFKKIMSYNVVVTSCRDAAILAEARLTNADLWTMERDLITALHPEDAPPVPSLHWGALLVDEAAQATEVDVLPAIGVVCPPPAFPQDHVQPRLAMAGDEHQLGPRTASRDPLVSMSLFARLFSQDLYAKHPLSRSNVKPSSSPPVLKRSMLPILYAPFTNLIRNYRSHPAILSVPSSFFYSDTLIPEATFPQTALQSSSLWQGSKWPVLYIPHAGPDELERDNGGWYNISEARVACSLAQKLVVESNVRQQDVCIMSPFAAQVKILRGMIRSSRYNGGNGLWDVNIGPVEAFQGLEKRVVILCTTRTKQRFVKQDVERNMGLVHQKRKLNVALTRAKEALIVIGSPDVLGLDEHWRAWLGFCERNGLVDDPRGVWRNRSDYRDAKTGVLEKALVARAEGLKNKQWPALGAAAADYDVDGDEYEAWAESLREALDEEED